MFNKLAFATKIITFFAVLGFISYIFNVLIYNYPLYLPSSEEVASDVRALRRRIDTAINTNAPVVLAETDHKKPLGPIPTEVVYGYPTNIKIERLGIDLEIKRGEYNFETKEWDLSDGVAYYAELSDLPSTLDGNTLIYAHNKKDAFYWTKDIEDGDIIELTLEDGTVLKYEYFEDEFVIPENAEVFNKKDLPRVTLLTCDGDLNEARRLLYGQLIEIKMPNGELKPFSKATPTPTE